MAEVNVIQAINMALRRALEDDPAVVIFGQDVGVHGGVFRATEGLYQRYGGKRVLDTPLAETMIGGLAVGMSTQGMKPVCEIQFQGFLYPVLDNLANHASRLRTRTRGRISCPIVLRVTHGGGVQAPEHHSEAIESILAHIPGLRVVIPSTPAKAYGLLLSAIRDPDPVIFLEPTRLYRSVKANVEDSGDGWPLDCCDVVREGDDLTLVAWGAMMQETLAAASTLAERGVSAEVIDVATIKPFDAETVLRSVSKTGRCVIVHEAARTAGFGAEIAAILAERAMTALLAPVGRVTGYDVVMPLPKLEKRYLPTTGRILAACERSLAWG
ncbi:MAG TPA: alpha-ketoacid dehydrogenase subunit beta [Alphaproteobacteria bacterium]|nr:alpha-ketoacid dehydrogenase subunit beta [Alphaproteobacteria bacterium]